MVTNCFKLKQKLEHISKHVTNCNKLSLRGVVGGSVFYLPQGQNYSPPDGFRLGGDGIICKRGEVVLFSLGVIIICNKYCECLSIFFRCTGTFCLLCWRGKIWSRRLRNIFLWLLLLADAAFFLAFFQSRQTAVHDKVIVDLLFPPRCLQGPAVFLPMFRGCKILWSARLRNIKNFMVDLIFFDCRNIKHAAVFF